MYVTPSHCHSLIFSLPHTLTPSLSNCLTVSSFITFPADKVITDTNLLHKLLASPDSDHSTQYVEWEAAVCKILGWTVCIGHSWEKLVYYQARGRGSVRLWILLKSVIINTTTVMVEAVYISKSCRSPSSALSYCEGFKVNSNFWEAERPNLYIIRKVCVCVCMFCLQMLIQMLMGGLVYMP